VLFDCGVGRDRSLIASRLAALGRPVSDVFLTHAHADHAGGSAPIREATDARFHASAATARIVEAADERAISLDVAKRAGIYPAGYRFHSCKIDRKLGDGNITRIGDLSITAIATPGHSGDHVSYLVESNKQRALVSGDALFDGGRIVLQDTWDCSVPDTCASIRVLAGIDFEIFLPGHGPFSVTGGKRHVDIAMARVAKLLPPQLFI
jgi:glyoxylase-like metal-dependent hydrolase (beta-lactamase superfamily II)